MGGTCQKPSYHPPVRQRCIELIYWEDNDLVNHTKRNPTILIPRIHSTTFEIFFVQSDGNGDFSWVTGSRLQRSQKAAIVEAAMLIDKKLNRFVFIYHLFNR